MWASAQHDGHLAEYRWRPLFNAAKFGWRPLLECHAVTLRRRETRWNSLGCPKLANRSQPLVGRSSPYCEDMWGRYCCLRSFFPIVDTCLSCEDIAWQSCVMVRRWRIFVNFCILYFQQASRVQNSISCQWDIYMTSQQGHFGRLLQTILFHHTTCTVLSALWTVCLSCCVALHVHSEPEKNVAVYFWV